jgi:hypothetical protein
VTEEQMRAAMRDPRYWRDRDPALVRSVMDGFRLLACGQDLARRAEAAGLATADQSEGEKR